MSQKARFLDKDSSEGVGYLVWQTRLLLRFYSAKRDQLFTVPTGFLHDYGSVPWIFQFWIPRVDGLADRAYVLHDYLVRFRKELGLSLTDCHAIFYEAMLALNVRKAKAKAAYRAVYCVNWMIAGDGHGGTPKDLLDKVQPIELEAA